MEVAQAAVEEMRILNGIWVRVCAVFDAVGMGADCDGGGAPGCVCRAERGQIRGPCTVGRMGVTSTVGVGLIGAMR